MLNPVPSQGPSTPFGSTGFVVLDSLRVIVLVLGLFTILSTPRAMMKSHTLGQKARLGATALFIFTAIVTEFLHLGDSAHWRLLVNLVASVFAAWGTWAFLRWETPTEFRTE